MTLRCHFIPKSVLIVDLTRFFCLAFGDNYVYVKTNEATAIQSATEMFAKDASFWLYKAYADIRYGSRAV